MTIVVAVLASPPWLWAEEQEPWQKCPLDMVPTGTCCIDKYEYPNKIGELPLNLVSFVEAQQLCVAQGKRLCRTNEWSEACSGPQPFAFPYGNDFVEGVCNLAHVEITHSYKWYGLRETHRDVTPSKLAKSGVYKSCTGGYGASDMLGNVWEWTDPGPVDHAILMGGCWATPSDQVSCLSLDEKAVKFYRVPTVGFRCCSDFLPKPDEGSDVQKSPE